MKMSSETEFEKKKEIVLKSVKAYGLRKGTKIVVHLEGKKIVEIVV